MLENLIQPSAKLAAGFGTQTLVTESGQVHTGTVLSEDKRLVTLKTPQGKTIEIPITEIEQRSTTTSPMPSIRDTLTLTELRDLIAYLAGLKE